MKKALRKMIIVAQIAQYDDLIDLDKPYTQSLTINSRGKVSVVTRNFQEQIIQRESFKIKNDLVWRLFNLIDNNFGPSKIFPRSNDLGFWRLEMLTDNRLVSEYNGPLIDIDDLGWISENFREILDRDYLFVFDGDFIEFSGNSGGNIRDNIVQNSEKAVDDITGFIKKRVLIINKWKR